MAESERPTTRPSFADWVLLPLRPWTLARIAVGAGTWGVYLAATAPVFLLAVAWLSFALGQISEPYPDMGVYLGEVLHLLPWACLFGLTIFLIALPSFLVARTPSGPSVKVRVLLLNHLALAVPIAGFLAATILAALGRPAFGIVEGKPAWLQSPLLQALGSGVGAFLVLGLYALNARWAFLLIGRDPSRRISPDNR